MKSRYDVVVVGSGPNGLSAAVALANSGLSTLVVEAAATPGGGARSLPLTLPGVLHDVCSTVHPLGAASPFFKSLDLERYGLSWVHSPAVLAHVLPDGHVVTLERSIQQTAKQFPHDGARYADLMTPLAAEYDALVGSFLGPLRFPRPTRTLFNFGLSALRSMRGLLNSRFRDREARGLLAGIAAHAMLPLTAPATASFGLVLGAAGHAAGWPLALGGSQVITDALLSCLEERGGELELEFRVRNLNQLPEARAYVFDLGPRQLLSIAGEQLPMSYHRRVQRFRYGPGVFKIDWTLREPVPWLNPACARAATVHLSGDFEDIAESERAVHEGRMPERPFVLFVQPSLFDATRAPEGLHIAWAYCHVPHGSGVDATEAIEREIERFAPGFRSSILARASKNAQQMEYQNPNYVGGDINGGQANLAQLFFRPIVSLDPYSTPAPNIFLCSSSTPPGGGVHGMCGYFAARSVLNRVFSTTLSPSLELGAHPDLSIAT
ncbi:MAG TPA: NAD(P)/FAD-dependent oxidoreductase [Polyangiaceae bacterium]|nr:NAD(P)/FAD-dependent oxidoreductase [Polyangiaceae bacterium]